MGDFVIRIPRVSVAVSEAELVDLLVEHGEHVEEGTPIYTIATEKVEQEIEAGAYVAGSNPQIDRALRLHPHIQRFLRQTPDSPTHLDDSIARVWSIAHEEVADATAA